MGISVSNCARVIRFGKVAVIYSPGFGAGWYSWHGIEELLFDPELVDMIERGAGEDQIKQHCEEHYRNGHDTYWGGADQLSVAWVTEGTVFRIDEYDGNESIVIQDDDNWVLA
jgi:hypothetical protein